MSSQALLIPGFLNQPGLISFAALNSIQLNRLNIGRTAEAARFRREVPRLGIEGPRAHFANGRFPPPYHPENRESCVQENQPDRSSLSHTWKSYGA
jgi:hypothetical protein